MTPEFALQSLRGAVDCREVTRRRVASASQSFGRMIASNRKQSGMAFARLLGVSANMLRMMETGQRQWPIERAELAVRLLTRREDWPD